jgi:hypothetical protein
MVSNIKFFLFFILLLNLRMAQAQNLSEKEISAKWKLNFLVDSFHAGDTLVFSKDKKSSNYFFSKDGRLLKHTFYMQCGNKFFADYFTPNPPDWVALGTWRLLNIEDRIYLTMSLDPGREKSFRFMTFLLLSREKGRVCFISQCAVE